MKVFIWASLDGLTDRYHSDGGCVVVAEDLEAARAAIKEAAPMCEKAKTTEPGQVYSLAEGEKGGVRVFIFPNSGCC